MRFVEQVLVAILHVKPTYRLGVFRLKRILNGMGRCRSTFSVNRSFFSAFDCRRVEDRGVQR